MQVLLTLFHTWVCLLWQEFWGWYFSGKHLEAIMDFPVPTNVTTVQSFLGLCNQLWHFIPNLSSLTCVLNDHLKKGVAFCWLPDHNDAFNAIKKSLVTTLSLHYFNANLRTRLITDVSCLHGLGYALVQTKSEVDFQPIHVLQCGLCSLNSAECIYSTISWSIKHQAGVPWHPVGPQEMQSLLERSPWFWHPHRSLPLCQDPWWPHVTSSATGCRQGYMRPCPHMLLRSSGSLARTTWSWTLLAATLPALHHHWRKPLWCLATPPSSTSWNWQLLLAQSTARSMMHSLLTRTPIAFWTIILQDSYSPGSQGNGAAKAAVKAMKALLTKMKPSNFEASLSIWRSTCSASSVSPGSWFFGHTLCTAFATQQPLTLQPSQDIQKDKLCPLAISSCICVQVPLMHKGTAKGSSLPLTLSSGHTTSTLTMVPWPSGTDASSSWLTIDHFFCFCFCFFYFVYAVAVWGRLSCPGVAMQQPGWTSSSGSMHLDPDFRFHIYIHHKLPTKYSILLFVFCRRGPRLYII